MKNTLKVTLATVLLGTIIISGCKKEEEAPVAATPNTTTTASASYIGVGTVKHSITALGITYTLQGDSSAYMIMAYATPPDSSFIFIKGYGSNGPGTPMTTGTYTVFPFGCDTCAQSHTLQPFEVIMMLETTEGGDNAISGTLDVVVNAGKPTVTFSNITLDNTTLKGFGKIIVP